MESGKRGRDYAENAWKDGVPFGAVLLACQNWGVPPGKRQTVAEEAASEAYSRTMELEFRDEDHYRGYVTKTARNYAIDLLRREKRHRPLTGKESYLHLTGVEEDREIIERSLSKLSGGDQAVIRMALEGLTLDEMAARLYPHGGASANALRLRVRGRRIEAFDRLHAYLRECGFG